MVWLLNTQVMKNCKSTESFCLSILAIYTNDWPTFRNVCCCFVYLVFARFVNICKPRTIFYLHWLSVPPGLAFYGSVPEHLPDLLGMVNRAWISSMQPEMFLQMKFIIFQTCRTKSAAGFYPSFIVYNRFSQRLSFCTVCTKMHLQHTF